jgi:phage-related minor tail protein
MALLVGELQARITADRTQHAQALKAAAADDAAFKQKVAEPAKIDGDPKPFSQAADKVAQKSKDTSKQIDAAFGSTWKSVASDLQRIEQEAWDSGRGMDKAFTSALDDAKQSLQDLRSQAGKTGDGLNSELGAALRKLKGDVEELGEAGRKSGESLSEGLSEALGKFGGGGIAGELVESVKGGKGAFLGAGLAVAGFMFEGLEQAWAENKVGALIVAQTGQAAGEAKRMGGIAGDVFVDGFAESIEDAGTAISAVIGEGLVPADAADASVKQITEKVLTVGTVVGEEADRVSRSVRTLLFNGLADNVSQALDLINEASVKGLNTAGDLLDTIDEYSVQFARVGLSGKESFGLLSQALQAGARDSDVAADAIKEFAIRAQDGSETTARGFSAVGLNAQEMGQMVAAGGASANSALRQTLNALQQMPPGLERSTAAVDLFGTKAEDMGDALFHMDLDDAADQFGDFAGSVEEAAQKLQAGQSGAEKFDHAMTSMKSNVGEFLDSLTSSDELDAMQQKLQELALALDKWQSTGDTKWIDEVKKKYPELSDAIDQYVAKNKDAVDAQNKSTQASDAATGSYEEQVRTLEELIDAENKRAGNVLGLSEAQIGYQDSIDSANESLKENGRNLDLASEAGRNNQGALNDLAKKSWDVIDAMKSQNATTQEVQQFMVGARDQFLKTAQSMGMSAAQANTLADKLGLIPGNYAASVQVTGYEQAFARAEALEQKLRAMPTEKIINLRVNTSGSGMGGHFFAGQATGAVAEYYADGGMRAMSAASAGIVQSYRRTGTLRVIADNPVADEAFIPLQRGNQRSQAILDEVLRRMRPDMAGGGYTSGGMGGGLVAVSATPSGPSHVDRSITVNAVQGVPTTQQLRDLQHEQEVLYGLP